MGKYRGLKSLRKYELKRGYKARELDPYRILERYRRPYINPRQIRSSGKYQRRKRRGGGGYKSRLRNFKWPQEYQRLSSEPKYKRRPKQSMSSPPKRQTIQYTKFNFKPEQNTEQTLKEIERNLDTKLSERLLEKLEAEFEELQRRISQERAETGFENSAKRIASNGDMTEEKVEVSRSEGVEPKRVEPTYKSTEIETSRDVEKENLEQREASESDIGDLSELLENSGERKGMSIEGPFEMDDAEFEQLIEELKDRGEVTEKDTDKPEGEEQRVETESSGEERIKNGEEADQTEAQIETEVEAESSQDAEVSDEPIETEPAVETESLEDVAAEPPIEAEVESKDAIEPMLYEIEPELLDAETKG